MPLEIRELIIKATVDNNGSGQSGPANGAQSGNGEQNQVETVVNLCVEKVLEILKEKSGR